MAKWFLGGELVGGETSWWRDDRIPAIQNRKVEVSGNRGVREIGQHTGHLSEKLQKINQNTR